MRGDREMLTLQSRQMKQYNLISASLWRHNRQSSSLHHDLSHGYDKRPYREVSSIEKM